MPIVHGTVIDTERLTPSMIRVVFGGAGLDEFEPAPYTDQYVNALFVPDGAPYAAPFSTEEIENLPAAQRPRGRRYTIRRWDPEARQVTIDFVAHGDVGYAGRWAQRARAGDVLQMNGPSGGYAPNPRADWYLLAGDESALPAIAASLEAVPAGKACRVAVVVDGPDCEVPLESPGDLEVEWLHRCRSDAPDELLPRAVTALHFPAGGADVFVHGEAAEIRAIRKHLIADRGFERDAMSISPYWRRNHDDEAWRAVKRDWLAEVAKDV